MSIHTSSSNNKEVENVSKRVKNTKKEIELLKAELQKLIHTGVHSATSADNDTKIAIQKEVKQVEPTHQPQPTKKNVELPQKKTEATKDSPSKKVRSYNVAEAKEYIKKQREKRAEQLKAQIHVTDNKVDLKKQKLKELHQKTLELVTKNVQLKRERSKSRDRAAPVRPDKASTRPPLQEKFKGSRENLREKSQDRFKKNSQENLRVNSQDRLNSQENLRVKSQDRLNKGSQENLNRIRPKTTSNPQNKPEISNLRTKSQERAAPDAKIKAAISKPRIREEKAMLAPGVQENIDTNLLYRTSLMQKSPQNRPETSNLLTKSQERIEAPNSKVKPAVSGRVSRARTRDEKTKSKPAFQENIDTNLLYPPNLILKKTDLDTTFDKTVFPPFDENVDLNKRIIPRQNTLLEHSIMTDACIKDTKETQTNRGGNFPEPVWLQPPPALPYPYNFINTVKRKLQHAINSPRSCVDVGVQNSESSRTPDLEKTKSREEIKELLIKSAASELKSFASHKCPNLDLQVVENLELVPPKKANESVSKNLFVDYDSESDTSKNIPEISSESVTTSQRNGNPEPVLSLDRLKDLKLHSHKLATPKASSSSNVKTDTNGYPEHDSYSSDFLKESDRSSGAKSGAGSGIKTIVDEKKHSTSSIKTVASEKKQASEIFIPSSSSISTNPESKRTSSKQSTIITDHFQDQRDGGELTFKSLLTGQISKSTTELSTGTSLSRSGGVDGLALKEPTVSLSYRKDEKNSDLVKSKMKNITIRPAVSTNNNVNEIHLKFEAEVRLLNDFNESLKQLMTVEKAFETLKNKNDTNLAISKVLQNVDTQTSFVTKTSTADYRNPTINFSRGSDIIEDLNDSIFSENNRNISKSQHNSTCSTDWDLSNFNTTTNTNVSTEEEKKMRFSMSHVENYNVKNCAGLSLNMFEQLIKDEDARIQHLKAIIKIREQALLDRTKGELVWLEIQKKQLIETGKIEEASLLKKKQRGIILKHEQERNEIKKLKQMQKEASEERKNILKQQRNLIKSQLSTKNMLSKIKVKTPRERRSSGPLRVVQSRSESIRSETSISRRSSALEDVFSVTSHSVRISEVESEPDPEADKVPVSNAKRTLFMREAALQKRRKAAEELLRWHRKLLDEERKIAELEAAATSVIRRMPREAEPEYSFNGKQLNQLWRTMTGRDDRRYAEDRVYAMSQAALEKFCKCARQHTGRGRKAHTRNGDVSGGVGSETERPDSDSAKKTKTQNEDAKAASEANYSSPFDSESVQEIINSQEEKTKISSISELIDNFSRIEDEISLLSRKSEYGITALKETSPREESKKDEEEDLDSNVSSKSSSQSSIQEISVLKTMTPNRVSEPEDNEIQTEETQTMTKIEEIASENKEETSDKKIESAVSREESEQKSSRVSSDPKETEVPTAEEFSIPAIEESEKISTEEIEPSQEEIVENSQETSTGEILSIKEQEVTVEKSPTISTEAKSTEDQNEVSIENPPEEIESGEDKSSKISTEETESTKDEKEISIENSPDISSDEIQSIKDQQEVVSDKSPEISIEETESSRKDEEVAPEKLSEEIDENVSEAISSTDLPKESLALDEAIESASKIEESLRKLNDQLKSEDKDEVSVELNKKDEEISEDIQTEDLSTLKEVQSIGDASSKSEVKSSPSVEEKTPQKKTSNQIDVKKRVSEILADANGHRGDKSPRLQDLYITAYDVGPSNSSEFIESFDDGRPLPTNIFGSEAEELWRKQLAIEQEIKQLEQQQKEQLPYVFMREIPNKPPPPYTPPSSLSSLPLTVLPTNIKEINEISDYSSKVLYKAYLNNNLEKVKFSENGFKLFSKVDVAKICAEFVFNICRDIAKNHYKQFEKVEEPSWLMLNKKPQLAKTKPSDAATLDRIMNRKLRELFGFKRVQMTESAIIKWGRKKRDHVDEILVIESQEEESQWTNFDSDELIVKDQITADIMKLLIDETANIFSKILSTKKSVVG